MPAQIAHILAGEDALLAAAPALAARLGIGPSGGGGGGEGGEGLPARWFRLGCQGPDIFYHNQRTKPSGLHYGSLSHRKNYGVILEGAVACLAELSAELFPQGGPGASRAGFPAEGPEPLRAAVAYLLGFATHAALDRALHPFVVCFSGWAEPGKPETERYRSCHPFLERLHDLVLLAELRGRRAADYDLESLLPLDMRREERPSGVEPLVVELLAAGYRAAYPRSTAGDFFLARRIENALLDARYFFRVTNPARTSGEGGDLYAWLDDRAGPRSVALVYPEELPPGLDLLNAGGREWPHPAGDGRSSRAGLLELYREGVAGAARALLVLLEALGGPGRPGGSLAPGYAALLGNGGLSVADPGGSPVAPRVSTPLPLLEALEAEFARRLERARALTASRGAARMGP